MSVLIRSQLMRSLLFVMICLPCLAFGQQKKDSVKVNLFDKKGQRDGMWYTIAPARMGEDAYAEFGNYVHGSKWGKWYKFDEDGNLQAEENYKNNVLDGEVKYFEGGRLLAIGHYLGLNPAHKFDTVLVVQPVTGAESYVPIPTTRGALRHGNWKFYDPETGRLIREAEYQVDEVIGEKEFGLTASDSTYFKAREVAMPHNQKHQYKPPHGRGSSLIR